MLSKKKVIAVSVLSLGLLAAGLTARAIPDKVGGSDGKDGGRAATDDLRTESRVAGSSGQVRATSALGEGGLPLDGIPVSSRSSYASAYRYVRQCQARRQFEVFVENSKIDPDSLQSRPEKIMQLDPDTRARYLARLAMLEDRRQECAAWENDVPLDVAAEQLYMTALQSALAGDQIAASGFVVKTWPMPSEGSPAYERVAKSYVENSGGLIDSGLANGSWPMVRATAAALASNHAIGSLLTVDSGTGYRISRLMQLGSGDSAMSQSYGYDAAQYAAKIKSPIELKRLDEEARRLFQTNFHSSYAEMTSFTTLCD